MGHLWLRRFISAYDGPSPVTAVHLYVRWFTVSRDGPSLATTVYLCVQWLISSYDDPSLRTTDHLLEPVKRTWSREFLDLAGSASDFPYPEESPADDPDPDFDELPHRELPD